MSSASPRLVPVERARRCALLAIAAAALVTQSAAAQLSRSMPDSLTNREFWELFSTASEPGGSFLSENFVSNEQSYQTVIPTLQRTLTPGGVYLGVGPEQNFTYIANLKPRMAVIFDIRRQNAMAHLMYKALFELAPTRVAFVSLLFSRPLPLSLEYAIAPADLFAAANAAPQSDSAFDVNRKELVEHLMKKRGFALTPDDIRSINLVYTSFFEAGPNINYGYRSGGFSPIRSMYGSYGQIQSLTNANGVNMAFLANEANYQAVRAMHMKNLIVPVVGDFAGPKAIRAVGEYLKQRRATVTAFYLSNVEQYLFRQPADADRFYRNVETLPIDSTSTFIRSVPPGGGIGPSSIMSGIFSAATSQYDVRAFDSAGVRVIVMTTTDSAGKSVTTRSIDSTGRKSPLEVFRSLRARDDSVMRARMDSAFGISRRDSTGVPRVFQNNGVTIGGTGSVFVSGGGGLVSGIAPIRKSLDVFNQGLLANYNQAIALTKTDGWKDER
jgi:hypothetical protein